MRSGRQVRVREVPIVVRLFLAAHRDGLPLPLVPGPGLLDHGAPVLQDAFLARDLVLDRLVDEAKRVDVLELGAGPKLLLTNRANRHVGVAAERTFLEVAIIDTDEHQHIPKLPEIRLGFRRTPQIGVAHDFNQRRTPAIEIDQRHRARTRPVNVLRRVLFDVNAGDPDSLGLSIDFDVEVPLAVEWQLKLRDLIALG